MSVKKNKLREFDNNKLFAYLSPESRYVPEAIEMAFEILKERGFEFNEEETDKINDIIKRKLNSTNKQEVEYLDSINIIYSFIYSLITLYFCYDINMDESDSLKYIVIFPAFYVFSGIISIILINKKVIILDGIYNKLIFLFSTPLSLYIFLFLYFQLYK